MDYGLAAGFLLCKTKLFSEHCDVGTRLYNCYNINSDLPISAKIGVPYWKKQDLSTYRTFID